jgi:hypothetical protein
MLSLLGNAASRWGRAQAQPAQPRVACSMQREVQPPFLPPLRSSPACPLRQALQA